MRHTTVTASAAVLLLALAAAGCGGSDGNADGKPAASNPSPSVDRDGQYIHATQDIDFTIRRPTNDELLTYPPKWCAGLDDGHSVTWLFSGGGGGLYPAGMDWGMVKRDAYQLLVAGVHVYCPEHEDAVTAELRATGEY